MAPPNKPHLAVVQPLAAATVGERIARLQAEARSLANEHVTYMLSLLAELEKVGLEISDGGEAYPVGVREIARRLGEDSGCAVQTLEAVQIKAQGR